MTELQHVAHTGDNGCRPLGLKARVFFYRKGSGDGGGIGMVSHNWFI